MTDVSFSQSILALSLGIILIVVLTTRYKLHAFIALMLACFAMGLGLNLNMADLIITMKNGFGEIMGALGLIILLGTTLGVILEYTSSTTVLANYILNKVGNKQSSLAMNMTGYVVGLPVFCDSGYIVLNGLNKTMARRTGVPLIVMAISLATGLYAVHCLIPPHPGAAAAVATLEASFGKVILYGMLTAVPAAYCGYLWSRYAGKKFQNLPMVDENKCTEPEGKLPSIVNAVLPVIIPILLIGIHAFIGLADGELAVLLRVMYIMGIPEVALSIGILLAVRTKRNWNRNELNPLFRKSVERAGEILVIIGAGGAFGATLANADIGRHFADSPIVSGFGIFFPFIVSAVLKTAQGSSSVAIITASSLILPLLPTLGLEDDNGRILCVLAMGAGSMVVSHANDSYFWVISRFSGIGMGPMLRVYTFATLIMGGTAIIMIYFLSLLL